MVLNTRKRTWWEVLDFGGEKAEIWGWTRSVKRGGKGRFMGNAPGLSAAIAGKYCSMRKPSPAP